jgi:hypothetical protein
VDSRLVEVARRQHGLLTFSQILAAGHRTALRSRMASGEWVEEQPRVIRPAVLVPTFAARITAVRLAVNAHGAAAPWCFSHRTAAHLHGLRVPEPDDLELLLPSSKKRLELHDTAIHRSDRPLRVMWRQHDPVPFVPLTVVQCAAVLPRDDLLTVVERAVRSERTDLDRLRGACARGLQGSRALKDVIAELSAEGIDRWMRRLVRLVVPAGLPRPRLEVPVYDGRRIRAYLDGYWDDVSLAVEVDDWETHGARDAQERDRRRDRWLLARYGIVTMRVTPREIRDRPEAVVADLIRAYRQQRRRSSEQQGPRVR